MSTIIQECFSINLKILSLFHLYPPKSATKWFKFRGYLMLFLLIPPIPILGFLYYFLGDNFAIGDLNQDGPYIAEGSLIVTKIFPFISNALKIKKCIHFLESPEFDVKNEKQRAIIKQSCQICKRGSESFICSSVVVLVALSMSPVITGDNRTIFLMWLPFEHTSDTRLFVIVYSYQFLEAAYTGLSCAAIDPLLAGLACLALGQFQILKDDLTNLKTYAKAEALSGDYYHETEKDIIHSIIKKCVDRHNLILRFLSEYEKCFSFPIFGQFVTSILIISFTSLQLSHLDPISYDFVAMFVCFVMMLVQLYLYCHYPTMLYEESMSLSDAICMGCWYEYDDTTRKELMILMERSKKPAVITAGNILEVSVRTFTTVIRRSYSLFAVLKNL